MSMVILLQWWYAKGWGIFIGDLKQKLRDIVDFFSIGQLLRTLFKPFRQISAGEEKGISAIVDKLVSRVVGFFARTAIIICGVLVISISAVLGGVMIVLWPAVPVLPIVGIILSVMGVVV